jgi:hypothetical protein
LGCGPSADTEHFISAPVRHDGAVLGFLSVYRLSLRSRIRSVMTTWSKSLPTG